MGGCNAKDTKFESFPENPPDYIFNHYWGVGGGGLGYLTTKLGGGVGTIGYLTTKLGVGAYKGKDPEIFSTCAFCLSGHVQNATDCQLACKNRNSQPEQSTSNKEFEQPT